MNKKNLITLSALLAVFVAGFLTGKSLDVPVFAPPDQRQTQTADEISVNLIIDKGGDALMSYAGLNLPARSTVLDALSRIAQENDFSLAVKDFPGLGVFIDGIAGVKSDSAAWWQYWVNGRYSQVGADQYLLADGDTILWRYAPMQPGLDE